MGAELRTLSFRSRRGRGRVGLQSSETHAACPKSGTQCSRSKPASWRFDHSAVHMRGKCDRNIKHRNGENERTNPIWMQVSLQFKILSEFMLSYFASRSGHLTTWQETREGGQVGGVEGGLTEEPRKGRNTRKGSHDKRVPHHWGPASKSIRRWDSASWSHYLEAGGAFCAGDQSRSRTLMYKRLKMLQECKKVQKNRTVESGLKRGDAGRMSFCDLLIGSAMHRLAPSRQRFALNGRECNEQLPILFTRSN